MPTALYRVATTGSLSTAPGRELIDLFAQLSDAFAKIKQHRAAMVQQKDDATDYTTVARQWGFISAAGALDEPTAEAAFTEIDSFHTAAAAALEQVCARLKQ